MTLHEPATFITDCLLSGLAAVLAFKLRRRTTPSAPAQRWLIRSLAALALSALVGGAYHGFAPEITPHVAAAWWWVTLVLIHVVSASLGLSLLHTVASPRLHNCLRSVIACKFAGFALLAALHPVFLVPVLDYGSTMLAWLLAALLLRRRWWIPMAIAISLSAVAASVQQLGWSPFSGFNHNDLYHLIQGLALLAFYRAGLRL
jgi:hypothetical protein